jgi:hypothetical protein
VRGLFDARLWEVHAAAIRVAGRSYRSTDYAAKAGTRECLREDAYLRLLSAQAMSVREAGGH